jgi:hypothetical protein
VLLWPRKCEIAQKCWQKLAKPNLAQTSNILWKVPLPGKGCSTLIVWKQRIYVTSPLKGKDALLAFDADGKTNLQKRWGNLVLYWDMGTSPVLTEKDVVVAVTYSVLHPSD